MERELYQKSCSKNSVMMGRVRREYCCMFSWMASWGRFKGMV